MRPCWQRAGGPTRPQCTFGGACRWTGTARRSQSQRQRQLHCVCFGASRPVHDVSPLPSTGVVCQPVLAGIKSRLIHVVKHDGVGSSMADTGTRSRRRESCHSAAPPSAASPGFNSDGERASAKWQPRRRPRHELRRDGGRRDGRLADLARCRTPQHGLPSKTMALITSDCGAMHCSPTRWPRSHRTAVQCTALQHDGPNHLGLRCNALPSDTMALITSDLCARQG